MLKELPHCIAIRRKHPDAAQYVLDLDGGLFGIVRTADAHRPVVCISNLSKDRKKLRSSGQIAEFDRVDPCTDLL